MSNPVDDTLSVMRSTVRFNPTSNIRFIAEELRRYGIKTNQKNEKGKIVFYQSAHIIATFDSTPSEEGVVVPSFALVSFKDLFQLIGKNDGGVADEDIVRVWEIAEKMEERSMIEITGTQKEMLAKDDKPDVPDIFANFCHIYRNDKSAEDYTFKSKFATNKEYKTQYKTRLIGISDYFLLLS